ncbi:MAG: T9SS type A sorting domain-containing protein [Saprospiraceae bacterium]|nr:T9SS type A sorting domain-containing protein [Saprospiraceae bacterium]
MNFITHQHIFLFLSLILMVTFNVSAQNILLDDKFDDWKDVNPAIIDKTGDAGFSGIDFRTMKVSNTDDYLFIYIEIGKELNLQSSNRVTLFVDADFNNSSGTFVHGIGADLVYNFGNRFGVYYSTLGVTTLNHATIGLISSPTVTSDRFEIAIKRKFDVNNQNIELSNTIRLVFTDDITGGDRVPDNVGGVTYQFRPNIESQKPTYSFVKQDDRLIRVIAYNVERDNLFNISKRQEFERIFKALQPDIIGFSEIYNNSSSTTAALIESFLPSPFGKTWHHGGVSPDIQIVSRYPIIESQAIDGNGAFLLNMGTWQLIYIVTHLPCCENEDARQKETDNIMSFVRNVRNGTSPFDIRQGTPIIIAGDMNFVGLNMQVKTLMEGTIINNQLYGPSFRPDWDDSDMDDVRPFVAGTPFMYTWNSPGGSFSAGRLDYMVYTGSVLDMKNSFVLNTATLDPTERTLYGLNSDDNFNAADHFPVVADFALKGTVSVSDESDFNLDKISFSLSPNPSNVGFVSLKLSNPKKETSELKIFAFDGKLKQSIHIGNNIENLEIPTHNLPIGLYNFVLTSGNQQAAIKVFIN